MSSDTIHSAASCKPRYRCVFNIGTNKHAKPAPAHRDQTVSNTPERREHMLFPVCALKTTGSSMDALAEKNPVLATLEALPDQDLEAVIAAAKSLLATRANERRKQALSEIRRIAKEHGLDVAVREPTRKPGRPKTSGNP